MNERAIIFTGVAIYIAIMAAIAIYASRRTHSTTEFVLAGRSLSLSLCTTTIMATWSGGGMLMGGSGAAYEYGVLGLLADPFSATLCLFLMGLFFVRIFRLLKFFCFIEFVEQLFGRFASRVGLIKTCPVSPSVCTKMAMHLWLDDGMEVGYPPPDAGLPWWMPNYWAYIWTGVARRPS